MYGQVILQNRCVTLMELVDGMCFLRRFRAVTEGFLSVTNTRLTVSILPVA